MKHLQKFWKFFYVPEKKKFKIFFGIFQKKLYGHLFHQKWNIFRKKILELFFEKFRFWQNLAQKIKKFLVIFILLEIPYSSLLQFSTNIRFRAYPEAEICTKWVFLDEKWHIAYNDDVIVTWHLDEILGVNSRALDKCLSDL